MISYASLVSGHHQQGWTRRKSSIYVFLAEKRGCTGTSRTRIDDCRPQISDCTSMLRYIRGWINPYLSCWTTQSSAENLSHIAQSGPIQRILNMDPQHPCKDFLRYVKERNATRHLRCCFEGNAIGQLKRRQNPDVF